MNEIIVPQGLYPGDRFIVHFASEAYPPALAVPVESNTYPPNGYSTTTNASNDTFEGT